MHDHLTKEHRKLLAQLEKAYDAIEAYHGDTEDEIVADREKFKVAFKRFARISKSAHKAGLLAQPGLGHVEAVRAAMQWVPMLGWRGRVKRMVGAKGTAAPSRRVWAEHETWIAKRANELHRQPTSGGRRRTQEDIRQVLIREAESRSPELAKALASMSQQAWNKRLRQLVSVRRVPRVQRPKS